MYQRILENLKRRDLLRDCVSVNVMFRKCGSAEQQQQPKSAVNKLFFSHEFLPDTFEISSIFSYSKEDNIDDTLNLSEDHINDSILIGT